MDKKVNLITKIKTLYPGMTESEKNISDCILTHPEEVYSMQIETFAKKLFISTPTVFRFAQKLGFNGFKDFKIALIRDIAVELNISIECIGNENDVETVTRNIFKKITGNLKETLSLIDFGQLKEAIGKIKKAKRILFFAIGSSLPVAFDSYMNFLRAGFNCFFNMDSYIQRTISTQCSAGDVAIGVSFSGESIEVVECLKNAQENGADTICVTTFIQSTITKYSNIRLFTAPVRLEMQKIDLPSKKSHTALLDVIYLNVVLQNREKALKYISKSEEELDKFKKFIKL